MCFSAEASIISYIIGTISSLYLLINGDKYDKQIGLFCLVFVQMQLLEFFMWIDQSCQNTNYYASILVNLILLLQPLSIIIGAILFKTTSIPSILLILCLILNLIITILTIYQISNNKKNLCSKHINNGYLEWDNINKITNLEYILYFLFMFIIWPFMKNKKGLIVFIFGIISLLFGMNNGLKFNFAQWESKWCFFSVSLPVIIILYNKFIKYK